MKYVVAIIGALVLATAVQAIGYYGFGYDTEFLAGWWSCMLYTFIVYRK
jgi:hypothetical protein